MGQSRLLKEKRFGPLFWTQFWGAFNDNLFKNALIVLVTFGTVQGSARSAQEVATLANVAAGLFILPFFLFSATAGQLADKLEKSRLIRRIKLLEVAIMGTAALGFLWADTRLLLAVLFLMGTQSALFGPVKYSILPQHLHETELVGGNGLIEMGTFVAIVVGTLAGTLLPATAVAGLVVVLAVLGYTHSRGIPEAEGQPALQLRWNIFSETGRTLGYTRRTKAVFLSILGISWFWFYGALFLAQLPSLSAEELHGNREVVGLLLVAFSIGIGVGSLLCERLSGRKVELGLVPFGSIGLTLFGVDLFFALQAAPRSADTLGALAFMSQPAHLRVLADLMLLGMFGGFYIVPLYAIVQQRSEPAYRSRIIAGNNILNALFMVVAALLAVALRAAGLSVPELFLVTAVLNAAVAIYIYTLLPEFLMRFLIWILVHTVYRLRPAGMERIPEEGPAVRVCNHVSFVDAPIIAAACRRPIRFVMDHNIFKIPVLNFIFRTGKAIPIAGMREDPERMEQAFEAIAQALQEGELVCIFPEGKITKDGELNPFRPGLERIIKTTPVPVVPLALRGLWGSFFSRKDGPAMSKRPTRFRSTVYLLCEAPIPAAQVSAAALQQQVLRMRGDVR